MIPSDVRFGDFGLVHMPGDVGSLIRVGQWLNGDGFGDYEHAFVYAGKGEIIEAEPSGARKNAFAYPDDRVLWSSGLIKLTAEQRQAIVAAANTYIGTPYSYADYFALAAHKLHIPAPHLKAYIASSKHMICSQLVDTAYHDAGIELFDDKRWPGYVTPGDLWQLLESKGSK